MPVKGLCTFTENTALKGSEDHPEEKQATENSKKGSKKHFFNFVLAMLIVKKNSLKTPF